MVVMSSLVSRHPAVRWLAPLVSAAVLASAGAVIAATSSATADQPLPRRSAAQLLVDVQDARLEGLSGTVVQTADLGLPALPSAGGGDSAEFSSLVSGSHTLRVWSAGEDKSRVALLGQYGESDLVRDGSDVWAWSSSTNTARHLELPAGSERGDDRSEAPDASALTPQQAADKALAAIDPTTAVSTDRTAVVAGRSAYQLVLEPKDDATLVGSVRIAIDGTTHVPLRVQVFATGASEPAFEVGFTSFDPSTPDDSIFAFNPPPGADVVEGLGSSGADRAEGDGPLAGGEEPTLVGSGWSSVVVASLGAPSEATASSRPADLGSLSGVVQQLPKASGAWGTGHVLEGALFSAVVTDDGRVAAGAVRPEALYAALGDQ